MPKKKKLTRAQLDARAKGQVASQKLAAAASKNDAEDEGREGGGHAEDKSGGASEADFEALKPAALPAPAASPVRPATKRKSHPSPAQSPTQPPPPPPPPIDDLEVDVDEIDIYEQYALKEIMELGAHYAALDKEEEEPDSEDDASAAASLGVDADADDEEYRPIEEAFDPAPGCSREGKFWSPRRTSFLDTNVPLPVRFRRSALGDENDYGDVADDDDDDADDDAADDADDAAADDAAADFGAPRESPLDVADAFAIADALADLEICDERDARAIAVALTALEDGPEDETERAAESLREAAWQREREREKERQLAWKREKARNQERARERERERERLHRSEQEREIRERPRDR